MKRTKKNRAAASLGRKGGAARAASLSPERRLEIARRASAVAHGRALPSVRWYVLWDVSDPDQPKQLFAERDKEKVKTYARTKAKKLSTYIAAVDFQPIPVVARFQPDVDSQIAALKALTPETGSRR